MDEAKKEENERLGTDFEKLSNSSGSHDEESDQEIEEITDEAELKAISIVKTSDQPDWAEDTFNFSQSRQES